MIISVATDEMTAVMQMQYLLLVHIKLIIIALIHLHIYQNKDFYNKISIPQINSTCSGLLIKIIS